MRRIARGALLTPEEISQKLLDHYKRCAYLGRAAVIGPSLGSFISGLRVRGAGSPATWLRSLVGEDGMRQNALFQLGTGLGTPGTARKEDFAIVAPAAETKERSDHFVVRN